LFTTSTLTRFNVFVLLGGGQQEEQQGKANNSGIENDAVKRLLHCELQPSDAAAAGADDGVGLVMGVTDRQTDGRTGRMKGNIQLT